LLKLFLGGEKVLISVKGAKGGRGFSLISLKRENGVTGRIPGENSGLGEGELFARGKGKGFWGFFPPLKVGIFHRGFGGGVFNPFFWLCLLPSFFGRVWWRNPPPYRGEIRRRKSDNPCVGGGKFGDEDGKDMCGRLWEEEGGTGLFK